MHVVGAHLMVLRKDVKDDSPGAAWMSEMRSHRNSLGPLDAAMVRRHNGNRGVRDAKSCRAKKHGEQLFDIWSAGKGVLLFAGLACFDTMSP